MHKVLGKLMLIMGVILTISACTSGISNSLTLNTLRLANLVMAIPACGSCHPHLSTNITRIDDQAKETTSAVEKLYTNQVALQNEIRFCATCHDSQLVIYQNLTTGDTEQSIRLSNHAGQIVECEVCHRQQPVHAFLLLRGAN